MRVMGRCREVESVDITQLIVRLVVGTGKFMGVYYFDCNQAKAVSGPPLWATVVLPLARRKRMGDRPSGAGFLFC